MSKELQSARIVVTGARGAIGRRLVRVLAGQGAAVTAMDMSPGGDEHIAGVSHVQADILDRQTLARVLDGADIVYHLAYLMGEEANHDPVMAAHINTFGGTSLLQACAEARAGRVLLASSVAVFGSRSDYAPGDLPLGDDAARLCAKGIAVYGAGKIYMEIAAAHYARTHGLLISGLRPGAVIGASRNTGRARTVANIVATAMAGEVVEVAQGNAAFQAIHIDDVVGAFVALATADPAILAGGPFFNLAGDHATIRSFCDEVAAQLPDARFDIRDGDSDELFGGAPCVADQRIHSQIGYQRRYRTLQEGIAAEIRELRA